MSNIRVYSNPPSTPVSVTPKTRGCQVKIRTRHGLCPTGLDPPGNRASVIRGTPLLIAAVIHAVLVCFREDPAILRDLVHLEEDLWEDGV